MGSSRGSTITIASSAVLLLLLVVVAEGVVGPSGRRLPQYRFPGRRGGGKHHNFRMDDCGRNRTCRKLSRECKKMIFASMVEDYVDAGDDEIITTVDKMAAMMEMLTDHQNNLTDCAIEMGIKLSNTGKGHDLAKVFVTPIPKKSVLRTIVKKNKRGNNRPIKLDRIHSKHVSKIHARKGSGNDKWHNGNFGVSKEDARELKKCLLQKKDLLNSDDKLNREAFKVQIFSAFDSQPDVQTAVDEAIDSCPEPQDYDMQTFMKCINKACIDNLVLDDDEDSLQENLQRTVWP